MNKSCIQLVFFFAQTETGPTRKCTEKPCENGGECIQQWDSYYCDCDLTSFTGPTCGDGKCREISTIQETTNKRVKISKNRSSYTQSANLYTLFYCLPYFSLDHFLQCLREWTWTKLIRFIISKRQTKFTIASARHLAEELARRGDWCDENSR